MAFGDGFDGGWVPYPDRDRDAQRLTDESHEAMRAFGDVADSTSADEPVRACIAEMKFKKDGEPLQRVWQTTGSCVGAAAGSAYHATAWADKHIRGDNEEVKMPCFLPTYGVGREKGGMRGTGSGSFGSSQAWAVKPDNFGMLPIDHPKMPKPSVRGDGLWVKYDKQTERRWSHPRAWPVDRRELAEEADDFGIHTVTRIRSAEEAKQALAQGFVLTQASSWGATNPRIEGRGDNKVLLGRRRGSWNHQTWCDGYWVHPDLGLIFEWNNQWGSQAHGRCPILSSWGVYGAMWCLAKDYDWQCRNGEVYAHSDTGGFPTRKIQWDLGITFV